MPIPSLHVPQLLPTLDNNTNNTDSTEDDNYYPWIMVRMEDLVFHAKETITQVCHCIGGQITPNNQPFKYIVESAKCDSPGHDCSTGMAQAWMKYGRTTSSSSSSRNSDMERALAEDGWTDEDYQLARQVLDSKLMHKMGYKHPAAIPTNAV